MFSKTKFFLICSIFASLLFPTDQLEAHKRGRSGKSRHSGGHRHGHNRDHDHDHDHDHHNHNHNNHHDHHVHMRGGRWGGWGGWNDWDNWDDWRGGGYYGFTPYEGNYVNDYYANPSTYLYENGSNGSSYKYHNTYSVDESKQIQRSSTSVPVATNNCPPPKGVFFNR